MSDVMELGQNLNGTFSAYDDSYDIVIHCESEEEQKKAIELINSRMWISVSERLPEESLNSVIGWDEYRERCVFIQFVDGQFKNCGTEQTFNITAWMPLPEPYKED